MRMAPSHIQKNASITFETLPFSLASEVYSLASSHTDGLHMTLGEPSSSVCATSEMTLTHSGLTSLLAPCPQPKHF